MVTWNIFRQGYNRAQTYRPKGEKGLRSASAGAEQTSPGRLAPRQGARVLLMDGTAVESAFALLLTKVTKEGLVPDTSRTTNVREGSEILYPAKISYNRHSWRKYKLCAISGTLFRRRGEEHNDEKNDQWHDWNWIAGS